MIAISHDIRMNDSTQILGLSRQDSGIETKMKCLQRVLIGVVVLHALDVAEASRPNVLDRLID